MSRLPSPAARRNAMNEPDQHSSPIKTPRQLIIVVVLASGLFAGQVRFVRT